jgi:hypothetical protein
MGHIVFAAPGIDAFGLHDRLARGAAPTLATDQHTVPRRRPSTRSGGHQGTDAVLLARGRRRRPATGCPRGRSSPTRRAAAAARGAGCFAARRRRTMARTVPHPDLLCCTHDRGDGPATAALPRAAALAVRVLWTGPGLLPHTLQRDERGLDGDAAASQRPAPRLPRGDRGEPELLQACLAHALAGAASRSRCRPARSCDLCLARTRPPPRQVFVDAWPRRAAWRSLAASGHGGAAAADSGRASHRSFEPPRSTVRGRAAARPPTHRNGDTTATASPRPNWWNAPDRPQPPSTRSSRWSSSRRTARAARSRPRGRGRRSTAELASDGRRDRHRQPPGGRDRPARRHPGGAYWGARSTACPASPGAARPDELAPTLGQGAAARPSDAARSGS